MTRTSGDSRSPPGGGFPWGLRAESRGREGHCGGRPVSGFEVRAGAGLQGPSSGPVAGDGPQPLLSPPRRHTGVETGGSRRAEPERWGRVTKPSGVSEVAVAGVASDTRGVGSGRTRGEGGGSGVRDPAFGGEEGAASGEDQGEGGGYALWKRRGRAGEGGQRRGGPRRQVRGWVRGGEGWVKGGTRPGGRGGGGGAGAGPGAFGVGRGPGRGGFKEPGGRRPPCLAPLSGGPARICATVSGAPRPSLTASPPWSRLSGTSSSTPAPGRPATRPQELGECP